MICEPCSDNCSVCTNANTCSNCDDGYYVKNGMCVTDCGEGYFLGYDECYECEESCLNCTGNGSDYCTECESPLYFHEDKCLDSCPTGYMKS